MTRLLLAGAACIAVLTMACSDGTHPESAKVTVEQPIAAPPAEVYAELDEAFTRAEAAAKTARPIASDTKEPIEFTFEREPGHRLRMEGKARWRIRTIHIFTDPGPTPNETRLRVYFEPKNLVESGGSDDLRVAITRLFSKVEDEFKSSSGEMATLYHFTASPRGPSGFAECSPESCG